MDNIAHYTDLDRSHAIGRIFLREFSSAFMDDSDLDDSMTYTHLVKATQLIHNMCISDIWFEEDTGFLYVKTSRPGILIGPRGKTIEDLTEYLKSNVKKYQLEAVKIREDRTPITEDINYGVRSFDMAMSGDYDED